MANMHDRLSLRPERLGTRVGNLFGLVTLLLACAEDEPGGVGVVRTDSVGVEIVTNLSPAWPTEAGWRIGPEPARVIGGSSDAPGHTLFGVRRVIRFPDGRIAVANGGTRQIRLYDSAGVHLLDFGRAGDGPGEFQRLNRLWSFDADSIMTYDGPQSRITIFDSQGNLGRTVRLTPHGGARQAFGMRPFSDGTLLVEGVVQAESPRLGLFSIGSRRFERYSASGEFLNSIAEEPSGLQWGYMFGGGMAYGLAPFDLAFVPSVGDGESLYIGSGRQLHVQVFSLDGRLTRVIHWSGTVREVDGRLQDAYKDHIRNSMEGEFRALGEAKLEGIVFPEHLPVYLSLLVDATGHLWVEQYRAPWDEERHWWVFDPSGRWLGEPTVPVDLTIREVGEDYVLGVRLDENDVESVVLFELERGN